MARKIEDKTLYKTANAMNWGDRSSYEYQSENEEHKLRIVPVSGVSMVGTNCTVLEYEQDIMIIDVGIGFPGEELLGIDALVPNLSYLDEKKQNIRGIVITHGHTDHIGGLQHTIESLGFPQIYAPRLAAGLIREKFKETDLLSKVKITEIDGDSSYYLGKFKLSHFKMTHTIPDNYGIAIDTPVGRVVTPSDYKFDSAPYKETPSDYSKLAKLGDEGVLLLMDESTNAWKKGWAESETLIAKDMEDQIRVAEGRLLIGMFSTMVNRIRQVIELAEKHGKSVAVLGRSLETMVKISHQLGYINVLNSTFVPFHDINKIPDNKLVILTTGSQGEPNAALMRMASDSHSKITLKKSDTIIFSSSRIPGNEGKIDYLINLITKKGVKVVVNDYLTIHATGHGHEEDHRLMLRLTKPKYVMPIHGEPKMLAANKNIARSIGYNESDVIMPHEGMVLEITQNGWEIVGSVDTTPHWVEGNRLGDFDPAIVEERELLMDEGVIFVTMKNVDSPGFGSGDISLVHKGFYIQKKDDFLYKSLIPGIVDHVIHSHDKRKETIHSIVKNYAERELTQKYDKKPMVVIEVL